MTLYIGMSQGNGKAITDTDHLRQSVRDILLTRRAAGLPAGNMVPCCPP
jgi:phage baseplate assembly protein W